RFADLEPIFHCRFDVHLPKILFPELGPPNLDHCLLLICRKSAAVDISMCGEKHRTMKLRPNYPDIARREILVRELRRTPDLKDRRQICRPAGDNVYDQAKDREGDGWDQSSF